MKGKRILIVSAVAAVGLTAAGVLLDRGSVVSAIAGERGFSHAHFGGHHGWDRGGRHGGRHGWARGGRHGGFGHLCGERRDQRIDDMISVVESFVEFTPEQLTAWSDLTASVREGSVAVGEACEAVKRDADSDGTPARLARLETMLSTGLDIVRKIRPDFEGFYATLSERQQKALDRLFHRGRRG